MCNNTRANHIDTDINASHGKFLPKPQIGSARVTGRETVSTSTSPDRFQKLANPAEFPGKYLNTLCTCMLRVLLSWGKKQFSHPEAMIPFHTLLAALVLGHIWQLWSDRLRFWRLCVWTFRINQKMDSVHVVEITNQKQCNGKKN